MPLLLLSTSTSGARPSSAAGGDSPKAGSDDPSGRGLPHPPWALARFAKRQSAPSTTTTTDPPPPTTTTTDPPPPTTTTTAPPPTTTVPPPPPTQPPPTAAPAAPAAPSHSETGAATWYAQAPGGTCASPTLPFGTTVTVVNDSSGASTTCVVEDREPPNPGRVLDMSLSGFSAIADPSQGVITVTISW